MYLFAAAKIETSWASEAVGLVQRLKLGVTILAQLLNGTSLGVRDTRSTKNGSDLSNFGTVHKRVVSSVKHCYGLLS